MSYDLQIGTHAKPAYEQIEAWVAGQGLVVERTDAIDIAEVSRADTRGGYLFEIGGPYPAEPDDFEEEVAAACLAPRWLMEIGVPYSVPKRAIALARSLARHLAETNEGAAFDPQQDGLVWPRGRRKRVAPRQAEEITRRVCLQWFLPPTRWEQAPATLLRLIARRCPEALPARYGRWEPPQHRFDPADAAAFVRFVLDADEGDGLWFASRPSFGGMWDAPHAARFVAPEEERFRIAQLQVDFDGRVLEQDPRWREAVVDLFVAAAGELGASFAAGQVQAGWTVTTNNRLYSTADATRGGSEYMLRGGLWQGLPPIPLWLTWYGRPYTDLVAPHLTEEAFRRSGRSNRYTRLPGRLPSTITSAPEPQIQQRDEGIFVRLGIEPRILADLGGWPLPEELTYRYRPFIQRPDGAISTNPAQPGDEAEVIPALS